MKLPGWLVGRFKGKGDHAEYSLEELDAILRADCAKIKEEDYAGAAPVLKDIYESFENMRRMALEIKELECPDDLNPRIKTVIRTAKPEYVREVLEALKENGRGAKKDLQAEKKAIGETMDMLAKAVMGPGKYLHMAYAEDIDRVRKELKNLAVKKKELEETSGGENDAWDLSNEIAILRERLMHRDSLEKERDDTEKKLEALKEEERTLAREESLIEEGSDYQEFLGKKEALQKIECVKEEKENQVYNLLTPLKRPLKILRKSLEDKGKIDSSLKEMERIADDPVYSFCSEGSMNLPMLLTALKRDIDGNPDIKAEEKSRVRHKISAIEGANLEKMREEIISFRKHAAELSDAIGGAPIQKIRAENIKELERIHRDLSHAGDEVSRIGKKIEKDSEEIESLKQELEKRAGALKNMRISVRLA
ncbi:MAG: hypothetical protein WAX07_03420 [Candidatus Altiarchaeia archaeon]